MMVKQLLLNSLIFLLVGCSTDRNVSKVDLVSYVDNPDNGFIVSKDINDISFAVKYLPEAYLNEKKLNSHTHIEDSITSTYRFAFRISSLEGKKDFLRYHVTGAEDYIGLLTYLSYQAKDDFFILSGNDTINPISASFVNTYGLAPYLEFSTSFKESTELFGKEGLVFVYNDKVFNKGAIRLGFSKEVFNVKFE